MAVEVTRITASPGSSMVGSGTSVTRTSRAPCQVSAFTVERCPLGRSANHIRGRRGPAPGSLT